MKVMYKQEFDWYIQQGWNELPTGIKSTDRPEWGMWECVREIVQNALDETEDYAAEIQTINGKLSLVIFDAGKGMFMVNFLLGGGEKEAWARGQFGEGLKFACLVALREGYDMKIQTVGTEIMPIIYARPILEPRLNKIIEIPVLYFLYRATPQVEEGTSVSIIGYEGTAYEERFAVNLIPEFKYHANIDGKERTYAIYDIPERKMLFVRDIYVMDIPDALFSYNLWKVTLTRERNTPEQDWEVKKDLGRLWGSCDKPELVKKIMPSLSLDPLKSKQSFEYEMDLTFSTRNTYQITKVWRKIWHEVFGEKAVIYSNEKSAKRATWKGYTPITVSGVLRWRLAEADIQVDSEVTSKYQEELAYPDDQLFPSELKMLNSLRAVSVAVMTMFYSDKNLPTISAANLTEENELGNYFNGKVQIERTLLSDQWDSISTLGHELAHHVSESEDLTKPHLHAVTDMISHIAWVLYDEGLRESLRTCSELITGKSHIYTSVQERNKAELLKTISKEGKEALRRLQKGMY